jgi:hypothetical protein
MGNAKKWMFNFNADGSWGGEEYDSREEAINEGINKFRLGVDDTGDPIDYFYIGEVEDPELAPVDFGSLIGEEIDERHCELGSEFFEGFTFKYKHIEELNDRIRPIVESWMREHDYTPNYFLIQNTERIEMEDDEQNDGEGPS